MVDKCKCKYKKTDPKFYEDERERFCMKFNMTSPYDESLNEALIYQTYMLCSANQSDGTGYDSKIMEQLLHKWLLKESEITESLHNMFLALKRCWTKHHLCYAYLLHNLTRYINESSNNLENPNNINETILMLELQYHTIIKNLQEKAKILNRRRERYIGDRECKTLRYSITAPAIEEIQKEIEEYEAYIEMLVSTDGVMMLDWYIRHTLLFNGTKDEDARSIYHTVFATKIMARLFQYASACQTVVIALFRYVAICMPFSAEKFCTYRNAVIACVFSFISSVLLHVPHFALIANDYNVTAEILSIAIDNETQANETTNFNQFFSGYHVFFYNIIMFFSLPFLLLTFFNFRLVQELYRHSNTVSSDATRENENRDVTKAVIAVVLVYVITYVPLPIYIIDKWFFKNRFHLTMVNLDCFCFLGINFIVWSFPSINSSVNFFIYCLFRNAFKQKVKDILSQIKHYLLCLCPCVRKRTCTPIILMDSSDSGKQAFSNKMDDSQNKGDQ